MEALRLAVHEPAQVAHRLQRFLFGDPHQRVAFDALVAEDDLHRALAHAERVDPLAAQLLHRVVVEEPTDPADSVVAQLVRTATRQALARLDAEVRLEPGRFADVAAEAATVRHDLQAVDDESADSTAVARLVAWLGRRAEEDA